MREEIIEELVLAAKTDVNVIIEVAVVRVKRVVSYW